jgi:hypothetical protein
MRPLTARSGRYHERACGANRQMFNRAFPAAGSFKARTGGSSPQATLLRSERVPAARARRREPARAAGTFDGWVGAAGVKLRITRRPRRTIGRLCCPIARTGVFVMLLFVFGRSPFHGWPSPGLERGPATFRSTGPRHYRWRRSLQPSSTHSHQSVLRGAKRNIKQQNIHSRGRSLGEPVSQAIVKTEEILAFLWLLLWIR